ncbi:nucleotide-binding protein frt1 [Moniliophthora roreri MCA 2997]|uniref:RNA exonuclease 4 n=2 Tax=Moniliophthora roreri TaxID=221103 RepID=V2XZQ4_MONRO|nr:nucleotide-binding protein frt1 [Moniliophthora roreri MCA 2997]KAI3622360.1 nucleotide-binding protein frt1 [Moniliophthora roreri]
MAPGKNIYAISCINVGVGPGGTTSMLARIAIVDYRGQVILDTYVAPTMKVTDYRTQTTGIQPVHLCGRQAAPFNTVQQHVANIIKGHIIVGHSIWNDLSVLGIPHPAVDTRDVALYLPFRNALRSPNHVIGLQTLSWQLMCRRCQESEQNPLENARAALDLYRSDSKDWEEAVVQGRWPCALPPSNHSRCFT